MSDHTVFARPNRGRTGLFAGVSLGALVIAGLAAAPDVARAEGITAFGGPAGVVVEEEESVTASDGAHAVNAYSATGDVSVTIGRAVTTGADANGVNANSDTGAVTVVAGEVSTQGFGARGIYASSTSGSVSVTAETISTRGDFARGIAAISSGSADVSAFAGAASTTGYRSDAVHGYSDSGDVVVRADQATTTGVWSGGVIGGSRLGDVDVHGGVVRTSGDYSRGVYGFNVNGDVTVRGDDVETSGFTGHGVAGYSDTGSVSVSAWRVRTTGEASNAISAVSGTGPVFAQVDLLASSALAEGVVAVTAGTAQVTIVEGALVEGPIAGVRTEAGQARIDNAGLIRSAGGWAIRSFGGGVTVANAASGVIEGRVNLTPGNDVIENAGLFDAIGNSDFGAGNDLFHNLPTGTVRVGFGATAPVTVTWANLETFRNAGLVDLRNGRAGDQFVLTGTTFQGQGDSRLAVDAQLGGPGSISDVLRIGQATGVTRLLVTDVGTGPGLINRTGILVVDAQATGAPAGVFVLQGGPVRKGWVTYDLAHDAAAAEWRLVSDIGREPFEQARVAGFGTEFWYKSADAWAAKAGELRDARAAGFARADGWEMWYLFHGAGRRVEGGERAFDAFGRTYAYDLAYDDTWFGLQAGGETVNTGAAGRSWWGLTGGFVGNEFDFRGSVNSVGVQGFNLGAYGGFDGGLFFFDGMAKVDRYRAAVNIFSAGVRKVVDGTAWGAMGEAGLRFGRADGWFLEPTAQLAWVRGDLDGWTDAATAASVEYDRATSLRGRLGARAGGTFAGADGAAWRPWIGVHWHEEFRREDRVLFTLGPDSARIGDNPPVDRWATASLGATFATAGGLKGFVSAENGLGPVVKGTTLRAGFRWTW